MSTGNSPIKSASADYKKEPFYFLQKGKVSQRYIAWFCDKEKIKRFLLAFISKASSGLEVKILDLTDAENPHLLKGEVSPAQIEKALDTHEEVIFHDGYHDLLLLNTATSEYVVFDQHGIIF